MTEPTEGQEKAVIETKLAEAKPVAPVKPTKKSVTKKVAKKATKKTAKKVATRKVAQSENPEATKAKEGASAKTKTEAVEANAKLKTEVQREGGAQQEIQEVKEEKPKVEVPEAIVINDFREQPLADLYDTAEKLPMKLPAVATKSQLVFDILSFYAKHGTQLEGYGFMEQAKDNYAMLRCPKRTFRPSPDDLYLGGELIREHGLKVGQKVAVKIRAPRGRDKYLSASEVTEVEGLPARDYTEPADFEKLTPLIPDQRLILERSGAEGAAVRVVDLMAPLGKGQRGLIVAPPRGGKTVLLKGIAKSIRKNHPEVELIILLLDERPEEVTDFEETIDAAVYSSTFDEPSRRHAQVADLVMERAKRLVELGKDVVILLDSLTRLARGHNNAQSGGVVGSGGLNPQALQKSRKFFGAARNVSEGGSLTILATALVETESRMDEVIFEEFKGTGNMEIKLDKELAERRIFPAIHLLQSGTRNDDRLYHPDELSKILELRRMIAAVPVGDGLQMLLKAIAATQNNAELLLKGIR